MDKQILDYDRGSGERAEFPVFVLFLNVLATLAAALISYAMYCNRRNMGLLALGGIAGALLVLHLCILTPLTAWHLRRKRSRLTTGTRVTLLCLTAIPTVVLGGALLAVRLSGAAVNL